MQKKYIVRLTDEERQTLEGVIKHQQGSSQKIRRAQIIRQADIEGPDWTDQQIAEAYHCRTKTVENIRQRFVQKGFQQTLSRKQRTISAEAESHNEDQDDLLTQKNASVRLTDEERQILEEIIQKQQGGRQKIRRAEIIRQADVEGPHWTDHQIAEAYHCQRQAVKNIRQRFVQEGFQKTLDKRRRRVSVVDQTLEEGQETLSIRKKYHVRLTDEERQTLDEVIKSQKGRSQKVRRAQIIRQADEEGPHWTNQQIAQAYHCRIKTVERIRQRIVQEGFQETLNGKQRATPPVAKLLDGEQEARIIATRLGTPPKGYANWSLRLLAKQVVELKIVEHISHTTIRKTLKKTE